jgi:hypothetical protein
MPAVLPDEFQLLFPTCLAIKSIEAPHLGMQLAGIGMRALTMQPSSRKDEEDF